MATELPIKQSNTLPEVTKLPFKFIFLAQDVKIKERPWSAFREQQAICVDVFYQENEVWHRCAHLSEIPASVLKKLESLGLQSLKSMGAVIASENMERATLIAPGETKEELSTLSQEIYFHKRPALEEMGWQVELDESFPFRPVTPDEQWYADLDRHNWGQTDWFDLELGLMVEGKRVNILPMLVRMLRQEGGRSEFEKAIASHADNQMLYVPMDDGQLLPVPTQKVRFIAQALVELYDEDSLTSEGKLRLSAWQSTQLVEIEAAMQATQMRWFGDAQARQLGARLKDFTRITMVSPPEGLNCDLRAYQLQGISWLQFLRENNLNGILADDMGLGKTIQTLAHILIEYGEKRLKSPVLVVAPTSLMSNWRSESEKFSPDLKVLVLHGDDRKGLFAEIPNHDLILTTYPLLSRDKEHLLRHEYHMVVLDEAQVIKNPNTMAHRIVQQIRAKHRLCLTGTPMENHLGELWALFYFLMPGFLGDQKKFNRIFRVPIEKQGDEDRRQNLARRVKPFMLRRTKQQVMAELPPKTEIIQNIELLPQQRVLYESIRMTMHERVRQEITEKGLKRSHIVILDALLKLRQVCCDPRLLRIESAQRAVGSAKMNFLMDILPEMVQEKRQILLFSQFTSMLSLIEQELIKKNIGYVKLTGQTKDRSEPVETFQSGKVPLFLISLKAGGIGLNLTSADTVIHFDPWWNPAVENQATDRAYRIGQDKPVFVYKLMTIGTVEEKIMKMQQRKAALLSSILNTSSPQELFSSEDLEALFEPLEE